MEPYIGEIRMFAGNFAPRGWAFCNGQLLAISQNTALFSLLGTTYGGNGQTTFGLPNLQGRYAMHWGQGNGLSPRTIGETAGNETVTLTTSQIPMHNHLMNASSVQGNAKTPANNFNAVYIDPNSGSGVEIYGTTSSGTMNPGAISNTGGSNPHDNMPPFQCVTFIIALEGIFPSRN